MFQSLLRALCAVCTALVNTVSFIDIFKVTFLYTHTHAYRGPILTLVCIYSALLFLLLVLFLCGFFVPWHGEN